MKFIKNIAAAAAVATMASAPVMAQNVNIERSSASSTEQSELSGDAMVGLFIAVIAVGAVIWAVVDDDDSPASA